MRIDDITVEVRDKNLVKQGIITPKYLNLNLKKKNRGVGEWSVVLPKFHPMTSILATPGSGIIVSLYGVEYLSGPTVKPKRVKNKENPDGTYTFVGVSDDILLPQALAFPQPGNADPTTQNVANDTRTGDAESLLRQFVAFNIANGALMPGAPSYAPSGRRTGLLRDFLKLEDTNLNRGPSTTKSPRFQNLAELLGEIGIYGNLGFQIVQRGSVLQFEVLTLDDVSDLVRLDINTGTLISEQVEQSPPTLTMAIVAGQGEGVDRQFVKRTTADSVAAEAEWGLRIEEFLSHGNTNVVAELNQAGDEALYDRGFSATAVKAIPSDDQTMKLVEDWDVGSTVGLVVDDQITTAMVTEVVLIADSQRVAVGAGIGDILGFDATSATAGAVTDTQRRVSKLERTEVDWNNLPGVPAILKADPGADRIVFWDDSAGALAWLGLGAPLSLAGTTLSVGAASDTAAGVQENSTDAEMATGTATNRTATPATTAATYYKKTQLDAGQLDTRYYTESEVNSLIAANKAQIVTTFVDARTFSTTSTSFVDVTGITVNITPKSASSKILILVACMFGFTSLAHFRLQRNGSTLSAGGNGDAFSYWHNDANDGVVATNWHHLDSPGSTSVQTYKLQCRVNTGTLRLNRRITTDLYMGTSQITVLEITP